MLSFPSCYSRLLVFRPTFLLASFLVLTCGISESLQAQALPTTVAAATETSIGNKPDPLAGKTVRSITVKLGNIFEGDQLSSFYQTVNELKVKTKEEVIRRELLFKEGQPVTTFLVQESERVLRLQKYLRRVQIETNIDGDMVDLIVHCNDTWTLMPQVSFSSGDGRNRRSIGLAETNLMGYGKRLEAVVGDDDGNQSLQGIYDDNRVFGSQYHLLGAYLTQDMGERTLLRFEDPFRSLIDPSAFSSQVDVGDGIGRLYSDGNERFVYNRDDVDVDLSYTLSKGDPSVTVRRYGFGMRYQESTFTEATAQDIEDLNIDPETLDQNPDQLASNRRYSGPFFSYAKVIPNYVSSNYIDRFERVQDFNIGGEFQALGQVASTAFGSNANALPFYVSKTKGWKYSSDSFLRGELSFSSRLEDDEMQNSLGHFELKYYNVLGMLGYDDNRFGRHTLAMSFSTDYGNDFDRDNQLVLGADNGLRGYDARTFDGNKSILFNVEDRIHLVDDVAQLFSLGIAPFFEIGGTSYDSYGTMLADDIYSTVGIGMMLAFPRSSGTGVIRLDLGVPLRDGPDGSKQFEIRLIISGGQPFNGNLRSEDRASARTSLAVGLE